MAEIILPPEEQEETPQAPELNIDKPTENSKVISIEFEAKKTNKVSTKDTNQQLYTTDTDAWFEFKETSLEGANGTYSVVFRNRHDGSIFQRTGDVVNGVAYYKIPHQEIRHAGAWRGQIVYTLSNGDTTSREFDYDVKGHILDGKDVREIVVEDFETLMSQLRSMKDNAESELANLTQELRNTTDTAEQNELERQQLFDGLVEDINEFEENERQRQTNEQGRESAESERVSNEEERIANEQARELAFKVTDVPAKNLIVNGDFSDGLNGWREFFVTTEVKDGYVEFIGEGTGSRIQQSFGIETDGLKYVSALVKSTSDLTYLGNTSAEIVSHSGSGEYEQLSYTTRSSSLYSSVGNKAEVKTDSVSVKSFIAINLTNVFGEGNEPTKEQMDKLLERFPNSWFDGTKNLFNAENFMRMYFKEIKDMRNAITALGGGL